MDYKYIINETRKNGGFTSENLKKYRYISSVSTDSEIIMPLNKFNEKELKKVLSTYTFKGEQGFGTWVNGNNVYIDINRGFNDKKTALKYAIKNYQLAIYDLIDNKEIITGIKR